MWQRQSHLDLCRTIGRYLEVNFRVTSMNEEAKIKKCSNDRYSWSKVAAMTTNLFSSLLTGPGSAAAKERSGR
jgi:hypothetical protein